MEKFKFLGLLAQILTWGVLPPIHHECNVHKKRAQSNQPKVTHNQYMRGHHRIKSAHNQMKKTTKVQGTPNSCCT